MERLICLVIGYGCGLIQTGYIYGRMHNIDIRKYGSGNAGSTNALRVMGTKAGAVVLLGDFLKTLVPCLVVRLLFQGQPIQYLLVLYAGLGVILGHNYPFYLKFKGGKGIAATVGLMVAVDYRVALACIILFLVVVSITRYVSLGSLLMALLFLAGMVYFSTKGDYHLAVQGGSSYLQEFCLAALVVCAMAFWRHRANIKRLVHGNENKFGAKKK